jgi:hypothetical protein
MFESILPDIEENLQSSGTTEEIKWHIGDGVYISITPGYSTGHDLNNILLCIKHNRIRQQARSLYKPFSKNGGHKTLLETRGCPGAGSNTKGCDVKQTQTDQINTGHSFLNVVYTFKNKSP